MQQWPQLQSHTAQQWPQKGMPRGRRVGIKRMHGEAVVESFDSVKQACISHYRRLGIEPQIAVNNRTTFKKQFLHTSKLDKAGRHFVIDVVLVLPLLLPLVSLVLLSLVLLTLVLVSLAN